MANLKSVKLWEASCQVLQNSWLYPVEVAVNMYCSITVEFAGISVSLLALAFVSHCACNTKTTCIQTKLSKGQDIKINYIFWHVDTDSRELLQLFVGLTAATKPSLFCPELLLVVTVEGPWKITITDIWKCMYTNGTSTNVCLFYRSQPNYTWFVQFF